MAIGFDALVDILTNDVFNEALYPEFGGWVWGGATVGATNAWLGGATSVKDIAIGAGVGVVSSVAGGAIGQALAPTISGVTNGIASPVLRGVVGGAIGGTVTGGVLGGVGSWATGGNFWDGAGQGALTGFATGTVAGGISAGATARSRGFNPLTGRDLPSIRYRALNPQDAASIARGEGITAKSPDGTWTIEEHLQYGSSKAGGSNDPWISTSSKLELAQAFESGNGMVRIDLNQVNTPYKTYWEYGLQPSRPYWYSRFHYETSIYRHVPQSAIKTVLPSPVRINLGY